MRRTTLLLAATAIALVSYGSSDGCDNPQALYIEANTYVSTQTQCQVRAGATQFRPLGTLDIAVANEYIFFPQISNTLPESEEVTGLEGSDLRLNNNTVTFLGVEVEYDFDVTAPEFSFIENYQASFFHASGTAEPGATQPTIVPIIGYELGNALRDAPFMHDALGNPTINIVARVVVVGALADHRVVRSGEFWFPITVCSGCLVYYPPDVDPTSATGDITASCYPGQDDGVDARLCYDFAAPSYVTEHPNKVDFPDGLIENHPDRTQRFKHYNEALAMAHDRCMLPLFDGDTIPESSYYRIQLGYDSVPVP